MTHSMQLAKFVENNEAFICIACGQEVPPHPSSSRDHCNHCLTGQHVDVNPGDRMNECRGVLEPIGLQMRSGKTQIVYRCQKCHAQVLNVAAPDDNADLITDLAGMPW